MSNMTMNDISSISEGQLHESVHYGPVTAVKFLDSSHVLVGYGPFLRVVRVDKRTGLSEQIWQERIFKRNKIHCISISQDRSSVAVSGGRSFAIVNLSTKTFKEKAINEWIVAVDYTIPSELLILTSHNEVLKVKISSTNEITELPQKLHCNEKSILYSGTIQRCNDGRVYIAAGTVMSGVLIWDLHTRKIIHNFTDHEGSIFAVQMDIDARYVISCSDDRSVKLFSFSTGELLASGWGHGSRIWSLSFYEITSTSVKILSTGEDCSARLWIYDVGGTALKQIKSFDNCHEGKHVWSGDAESQSWQCILTGGADGKVRLLDVFDDKDSLSTFDIGDIQTDCAIILEKKEVIKHFVQLPKIGGIVVLTNLGNVFCHTKSQGWSLVEIPKEQANSMREFSMLCSFPSASHVVICTRSGDLIIVGFSGSASRPIHLEIIPNSSFRPIKIINVLSWSSPDRLLLLLVSPAGKFPLLAKEFIFENNDVTLLHSHELDNPDPRVFTPTSVFFDPDHLMLLVGSRHANFAAYKLTQGSQLQSDFIRKICPGDTVTSISKVHSTVDYLVVAITVRDGTYMMVKFTASGSSIQHEILHQNKFTKGFVEGSFYERDQLYIYGFRSSSFFIWNETRQLEIDHVPCGGAHRRWEFLLQEASGNYRFGFLRNTSLVFKDIHNRLSLAEDGLLLSGTHGREIRSLALCSRREPDDSKLFVSASEDATIKVGYVNSQHAITYKWTMSNHVSGLQAVQFLDDEFFASSAANEELIVWKLNRDIPSNIGVKEHARIETSDKNPDLRIMDISSVTCGDGFYIAAGYSNSVIRIFHLEKTTRVFSLVAEDVYSTFCILNIELIKSDGSLFLMAGTTDGSLSMWDVTHSIVGELPYKPLTFAAPIIKQQIHQSGLKALLLIPVRHNTWKLISGGDDNSLMSADLKLNSRDALFTIESFVETAASATITGISLAGDCSVVVTSVDQIVRKWSFAEGLVCESATYTSVADTGCCVSGEFDGKMFAVVGGAGLSVFEI
ncbi:hypothetical protein OXX79_011386 [Metschnikowia pulcherrima]